MMKSEKQKVSKQFINMLKQTPLLIMKKQIDNKDKEIIRKKQSFYGPIEQSFQKIGQTYFLQNEVLKKKCDYFKKQSAYQEQNQFFQEVQMQEQNIERVKQIAKLQYLQKKGYLKSEEQERLQALRKQKNVTDKLQRCSNKDMKLKQVAINSSYDDDIEYDRQNMNPNMNFNMSPHMNPNMYYQDYPEKIQMKGLKQKKGGEFEYNMVADDRRVKMGKSMLKQGNREMYYQNGCEGRYKNNGMFNGFY